MKGFRGAAPTAAQPENLKPNPTLQYQSYRPVGRGTKELAEQLLILVLRALCKKDVLTVL